MSEAFDAEKIKLVYEHAWNWFSHHAEQRMTAFRFFLVVFGIFCVGYYQTINSSHFGLACAFALLGAGFSILFWRLDLRTRELIRTGEDLLTKTEDELTSLSKIQVDIIKTVDTKSSRHAVRFLPKSLYSYGQIFSAIFTISIIFSLSAATYAGFKSDVPAIVKQKLCAI